MNNDSPNMRGRKIHVRNVGRRSSMLMPLEPRLMFDGAAVADAAHAAASAAERADYAAVAAPVMVHAADPERNDGKKEVVFVDTSVSNWQSLVRDLESNRQGVEIELLDSGASGLAQIAAWAQDHSGYDSMHILSQGGDGFVLLGQGMLSAESLDNATSRAEMADIGSALKAGSDILLYGSCAGEGSEGQALIDALHLGTGASVAAASHDVGTVSDGGASWTLDVHSGDIAATPLDIPGYLGALSFGGRANADVQAPITVQDGDLTLTSGRREVVFVDTQVDGWTSLVRDIQAAHPGFEIELIDGTESGLAALSTWAAGRSDYDAIHILSHGSESTLYLGSDAITDHTVSDAAIQSQLTAIGRALKADGDLLLYGCDIAKGSDGLQLVDTIATLTGHDVAASDDATGAAALGGDWTLEVTHGTIDSQVLVMADYQHELTSLGTVLVATPGLMSAQATGYMTVISTFYNNHNASASTYVGHFTAGQLDNVNLLYVLWPNVAFNASDISYMSSYLAGGRAYRLQRRTQRLHPDAERQDHCRRRGPGRRFLGQRRRHFRRLCSGDI